MACARKLVAALATISHFESVRGASMTCGSGVALCGVLSLDTGLGPAAYHHEQAYVHGLWPETGNYGTSQCIAPKDRTPPTTLYNCYQHAGDSKEDGLRFETHEWEKHGTCAGVADAGDYFTQVCSLGAEPISVLRAARQHNRDFSSMVQALKDKGYPVWALDTNEGEIRLSACAKSGGRWMLATVDEMPTKCGGGGPAPAPPSPSPSPSPHTGECVPGKRGPKCSTNADCAGLDGCVRCAHSGYCTDQQKFEFV